MSLVFTRVRSSIESEPALVLGPLRSLEEQRHEQQLHEIDMRRQERERRAAEEDGGARDDGPPIQEKADELTGPFHYDFSHWARSEPPHEPHQKLLLVRWLVLNASFITMLRLQSWREDHSDSLLQGTVILPSRGGGHHHWR